MNETARDLGAFDTSFSNPHGLDARGAAVHQSSASDIGRIAATAMQCKLFRRIASSRRHSAVLWRSSAAAPASGKPPPSPLEGCAAAGAEAHDAGPSSGLGGPAASPGLPQATNVPPEPALLASEGMRPCKVSWDHTHKLQGKQPFVGIKTVRWPAASASSVPWPHVLLAGVYPPCWAMLVHRCVAWRRVLHSCFAGLHQQGSTVHRHLQARSLGGWHAVLG